MHRLHDLPHSTYPIEALKKLREIQDNANKINKWVHPSVMADLIASHVKGKYNFNFNKARKAMITMLAEMNYV